MDMTTIIGILISLAVGFALKQWPAFNTKFIPIVNFVIGILTQIVNAVHATGAPGFAPVHSMLAVPLLYSVGSIFQGEFFKVLVNALLQALLATGTHSAVKNTVEGLKGSA